MDLKELYKEIILEHGKSPRNFGKCKDHTLSYCYFFPPSVLFYAPSAGICIFEVIVLIFALRRLFSFMEAKLV